MPKINKRERLFNFVQINNTITLKFLYLIFFKTNKSSKESIGCSITKRSHCSEHGSRIFCSGPIGVVNDIIIFSRIGSIGGFVTIKWNIIKKRLK